MVEQSAKVSAIACPNCGGSIDLFGGHSVRSIGCRSCGALLDPAQDFAVVSEFRKRKLRLPLKPGMVGVIKGVEFTVIGFARWAEQDEGETYHSVDFQLFSPTHGYAWLRREEGHFLFVREVKDIPDILINPRAAPAQGTTFNAKGMSFKVHEWGHEEVEYVEGELTAILRKGDGQEYVDAACPPYMYEVSQSGTEMEYAFGEYMTPAQVYEAFAIESKPLAPRGPHFCQEYEAPVMARALVNAVWFAVASLLITVAVIVCGRGTAILQKDVTAEVYKEGKIIGEFAVTKPNQLMRMELSSSVDNSWVWYNASVRKGETEYFALSREISYYHGGSGEDAWSEGSRKVKSYFRLPDKGKYQVYFEGEGEPKKQWQPISVTVKKGVIPCRYVVISTVILGFLAVLGLNHRRKFMREQQGVDDDD